MKQSIAGVGKVADADEEGGQSPERHEVSAVSAEYSDKTERSTGGLRHTYSYIIHIHM